MNHTLGLEDFKRLVRGEIITLRNGDRLALADIGYFQMSMEIARAASDHRPPEQSCNSTKDTDQETGATS